jgi:hypothetical protein
VVFHFGVLYSVSSLLKDVTMRRYPALDSCSRPSVHHQAIHTRQSLLLQCLPRSSIAAFAPTNTS